jgi:Tol biopolymer transport system component
VLPVSVLTPAFSLDGQLLAAVTDDRSSLVVMNADGTNERTLINYRMAGPLAWSPDRRQLAFVCADTIPGYSLNICVVSADGGNASTIRRITHREIQAAAPSWSPDGRSIVFGCAPGGYSYTDLAHPNPPEPFTPASVRGLCIANADGSGWRPFMSGNDEEPRWSWATNQIVFLRDYTTIMIANGDGSGVREVPTSGFSNVEAPTWSSDGRRIAFVGIKRQFVYDSWRQLDFDTVYLVNLDGTGLTRLTTGMDAETPTWSPSLVR